MVIVLEGGKNSSPKNLFELLFGETFENVIHVRANKEFENVNILCSWGEGGVRLSYFTWQSGFRFIKKKKGAGWPIVVVFRYLKALVTLH